MANNADTIYKITGSRKAVNDLWTTLQKMKVDSKDIWLIDLAEHYGIDYEKKHISVRGHIYFADYEANEQKKRYLLTIETETAWNACNELFDAINAILWDELVISYREIETGCEIFNVHDEENFFPEGCCVSSYGEPFEDAYGDVYDTVKDAIKDWCDRMGVEQGNRSENEMIAFINNYKYDNLEKYFYIYRFNYK